MSDIAIPLIKRQSAGTAVLGILLALYYGTVVLAGFHFTVLQIVTVWGLVLIFMPAYRASLTRSEVGLFLSMTAIFAVAVLSYVVNGLWDHPDANLSRYARFLFFVPIYFVIRRFVTPAAFWYALLCGALVTGIWGALEFAGLVSHPDDKLPEVSGAVNSIQFGDLSLAMAAMTCAGLPIYRTYGRPYLTVAIFAVALGLFACLVSNTRGAWIAIPALLVLPAWIFLRAGIISSRWRVGLVLAGAVFLLLVISHSQVSKQTQRVLTELQNYGQGRVGASVGARLEMWRASWETSKQHPLLGAGPGLYRTTVQALAAEQGGYDAKAMTYSHPHSEYFFVLVTLGSLGILGLALLFLVPLYRFGRAMLSSDNNLRWPGLAGTVMVVGYLHFGLTEALMFQHATFLGFYLLSVATLSTLIDRRQREFAAGGVQ